MSLLSFRVASSPNLRASRIGLPSPLYWKASSVGNMVLGLLDKPNVETYKQKKAKKGRKTILVLGMQSAGKSTLIYQIKLGKCVDTVPTLGQHLESTKLHGINVDFVDIGGSDFLQQLWSEYVKVADAIMYVVDSTNEHSFPQASDALAALIKINPSVRKLPLLVLANKQDLSQAQFFPVIEKTMDLGRFDIQNALCIPCSAKTGKGLNAAVLWLTSKM